ncbi:hypothetical protein KI387_025548, partial [Taxus chinensis]
SQEGYLIMCISLLGFCEGPKTKVRNLTDRPLDVQIRVGVILKKAYRLKLGSSKTLRSRGDIQQVFTPRPQY